jgi:hypothetical protein
VGNVKDEEADFDAILDSANDEDIQGFGLSAFDPGAFNQSENKNVFVKNYGI